MYQWHLHVHVTCADIPHACLWGWYGGHVDIVTMVTIRNYTCSNMFAIVPRLVYGFIKMDEYICATISKSVKIFQECQPNVSRTNVYMCTRTRGLSFMHNMKHRKIRVKNSPYSHPFPGIHKSTLIPTFDSSSSQFNHYSHWFIVRLLVPAVYRSTSRFTVTSSVIPWALRLPAIACLGHGWQLPV